MHRNAKLINRLERAAARHEVQTYICTSVCMSICYHAPLDLFGLKLCVLRFFQRCSFAALLIVACWLAIACLRLFSYTCTEVTTTHVHICMSMYGMPNTVLPVRIHCLHLQFPMICNVQCHYMLCTAARPARNETKNNNSNIKKT